MEYVNLGRGDISYEFCQQLKKLLPFEFEKLIFRSEDHLLRVDVQCDTEYDRLNIHQIIEFRGLKVLRIENGDGLVPLRMIEYYAFSMGRTFIRAIISRKSKKLDISKFIQE